MFGGRFLIVCLIGLLCGAAEAQQEAPVGDCDRYAASDYEQTMPGVPFEKIDPKIAIPACQEALKSNPNSLQFQFELGRAYLKAGDYAVALPLLRKAADQGYAPAQGSIGSMYMDAKGLPKDEKEAFAWHSRAAQQGFAGSQISLGFMYEKGIGVPQNYASALSWYRKAADQGVPSAQDSVGYFYAKGLGVKRDDRIAVDWLNKAALQGMAGAEYNLGTMYEAGSGVPQNRSVALSWYKKAADQGNAEAMRKLATQNTATQSDDAAGSRQRQQTEQANLPKFKPVRAVKLRVVPGAIVCPDHETVVLMYDIYTAHWTDTMQDRMSNGQSELLRGRATPAPNLEAHGCSLFPAGTPMTLERGNIVPVVSVKLPNGKVVRGVTLQSMITKP